jgi:hypothetical protein
VPVAIAYLAGVGVLLTVLDRIMAAVDWEHRYRASYVLEHGAAFSSPVYLFTFAAIDFVLGVLLIWGANRASKGVTKAILIVVLVGTEVVTLSNFWHGSDAAAALIRMVLPTLMLALLLTRSSRSFFHAGAQ